MRELRTVTPAWVRSLVKRSLQLASGKPSKQAEIDAANSQFAALVTDRKRWLFETLPYEAATYHYDIFSKESQRQIARRLGLPMSTVYVEKVALHEALAHIESHALERFAIKPNSGHSSIGFRPLVRENGGYRDLRKGKPLSLERIGQQLADDMRRIDRPDEWLLEELLLPADGSLGPLEDFKLYCFGGRVELIVHSWKLKRPPWKRRNWYTRDWDSVLVSTKGPNHAAAHAPLTGRELVATAEAAASQLCYPFIRVDLYNTSVGVRLGEPTPGPGGRHRFLPEWDERLGRLWRAAADDLAEGIRSGRVQPLTPVVAD